MTRRFPLSAFSPLVSGALALCLWLVGGSAFGQDAAATDLSRFEVQGHERLAWDQQASSAGELAGFGFVAYVNGRLQELPSVECAAEVPFSASMILVFAWASWFCNRAISSNAERNSDSTCALFSAIGIIALGWLAFFGWCERAYRRPNPVDPPT